MDDKCIFAFFKIQITEHHIQRRRIIVNQNRKRQRRFMYKYKINQSVFLPEKEGRYAGERKRKKRKMAGWRGIGYRHTLWFPYKYFSVIHTWIVRNVVHGGYCRLFLGSVCGVCVCCSVWLITAGSHFSSCACGPAAPPWWPSQTPPALPL